MAIVSSCNVIVFDTVQRGHVHKHQAIACWAMQLTPLIVCFWLVSAETQTTGVAASSIQEEVQPERPVSGPPWPSHVLFSWILEQPAIRLVACWVWIPTNKLSVKPKAE